jgi:hypothetical protein
MNKDAVRFLFLNVRSIKTLNQKTNELLNYKYLVENEKPGILGFNETWLDSTIVDEELLINGYDIFRKDRGSRGGGLLLLIKSDLKGKRRSDLELDATTDNEIIVCSVILPDNSKLAVILFYRPPSSGMTFNDNFYKILTNVRNAGFKKLVALGDMNAPCINWDSLTSNTNDERFKNLCDVCDEFGLSQINNNKSREMNSNILDVILTDCVNKWTDVSVKDTVINTDHYMIMADYLVKSHMNYEDKGRYVYQFYNANYDELKYYLESVDLEGIVLNCEDDVNLAWDSWKSEVMKVVDKCIPKKKCKGKKQNPWIDGDVLHNAHIKESLFKKAKLTGKQIDWDKFKKQRNYLKNLINKKYSQYVNEVFDDIAVNPKKYWGLVSIKSKRKCKSVPNEVNFQGISTSDPSVKSQYFNDHFYNSFNDNQYDKPPVVSFMNNNLSYLVLSELEVFNVLSKIDGNKAYRSNDVPAIIFKECADVLYKSLTLLFNKSLELGIVPTDWKLAKVVPIYKSGDTSKVENYRPVSLLTTANKVLERCVHHHIYEITKLDIHKNQHGFMSARSTTSQLLECYNNIYMNFDQNKQVDVAFLDFSKAFDSVPHELLIHKLTSLGFNNNLLKWFQNYLSGRTQQVTVNGTSSKVVKVISGVPQGSILGPLLFLYYVNDLFKCIGDNDHNLFMYADDAKLVTIVNDIECSQSMQDVLNLMNAWSIKWGLRFNPTKCKVMNIARKGSDVIKYDYKINDVSIENVDSFMDLGLKVQHNLQWNLHIEESIKKANKRLGLLKRTLGHNCTLEAKLLAYKSMVRPLLEYCSNVWFCGSKKLMKNLESVQKRATKFITNNYIIGYKERLLLCNLLPISYRRDYLDLSYVYNCLVGKIDINLDSLLEFQAIDNVRTRANFDYLLLKNKFFRLDLCKNYFSYRVVKLWNSVPIEIREIEPSDSGLTNKFKKKLREWFFTKFNDRFSDDNICTWMLICECAICRPY